MQKLISLLTTILILSLAIGCAPPKPPVPAGEAPPAPVPPASLPATPHTLDDLAYIQAEGRPYSDDADPEPEGAEITILWYDTESKLICFEDVLVKVTIEIFAAKSEEFARRFTESVYKGEHHIDNYHSNIRIPFEQIKANPEIHNWAGRANITVLMPQQEDFSVEGILVPLCPKPPPKPPLTPAPVPEPEPVVEEPEPVVEPTPSTPTTGYARSDPATVGTELFIEDQWLGDTYKFNITPLEIVRGAKAWSRIEEANMFNRPPPSGFEYVLVRIRFEYLEGPTPDTSYGVTDTYFTTVSSEGKDYDGKLIVCPEPKLDVDLYPGASHEGWGAFVVAVEDDEPLLTFGRDFRGRGGVWWQLYRSD